MGFNLESNNSEINEVDDNPITSEQLSETEETSEDFDDCKFKEIEDSNGKEVNSDSLKEAEEDFDDCEAKLNEMEDKNPELNEEDYDDFDDCGSETNGQYVAEVTYVTDGEIDSEEAGEEIQEAYDKCEDPENMGQLEANANENEHIEVVNAEVIERPEDGEMGDEISEDEYEDAKKEMEEAQENLESQQEAAQEYKNDLENNEKENNVSDETENINNEVEEKYDGIDDSKEEFEETEEKLEEQDEELKEESEETEEKLEEQDEELKEESEETEEKLEEQDEELKEESEETEEKSENQNGELKEETEENQEKLEDQNEELKEESEKTQEKLEEQNEELKEESEENQEKLEEQNEELKEASEETQEKFEEQNEELKEESEETKEKLEEQNEELKDESEETQEKLEEQNEELKEEFEKTQEKLEEQNEELKEEFEETKEKLEEQNEKLKEESEETQEKLEEQNEELKEETQEEFQDAGRSKDEIEAAWYGMTVDEYSAHKASEQNDITLKELMNEKELNVEELEQVKAESDQLSEGTAHKFEDVMKEVRGTESYKKALQDYNAARDKQTELQSEISKLEKNQSDLNQKTVKLRNAQLRHGEMAMNASEASLEMSDSLQERFDQTFYGNADFTELSLIQKQNTQLISEMAAERDAIQLAMDAKMSEIQEYVYANNFERYDTERNPYYQKMISEYRELNSAYGKLKYNVIKLDENNIQISEVTGSDYESIRYKTGSAIAEVNNGSDIPGKTEYFIDETRAKEVLTPFNQSKWENLSVHEQKHAIEQLAQYNADILGIQNPPAIVYYKNDDVTDFGGFSASQHTIYINEQNMRDAAETADTISHEYRHCYQHERAELLENERDLEYKEGFDRLCPYNGVN